MGTLLQYNSRLEGGKKNKNKNLWHDFFCEASISQVRNSFADKRDTNSNMEPGIFRWSSQLILEKNKGCDKVSFPQRRTEGQDGARQCFVLFWRCLKERHFQGWYTVKWETGCETSIIVLWAVWTLVCELRTNPAKAHDIKVKPKHELLLVRNERRRIWQD